jgi:hypothetical protein
LNQHSSPIPAPTLPFGSERKRNSPLIFSVKINLLKKKSRTAPQGRHFFLAPARDTGTRNNRLAHASLEVQWKLVADGIAGLVQHLLPLMLTPIKKFALDAGSTRACQRNPESRLPLHPVGRV